MMTFSFLRNVGWIRGRSMLAGAGSSFFGSSMSGLGLVSFVSPFSWGPLCWWWAALALLAGRWCQASHLFCPHGRKSMLALLLLQVGEYWEMMWVSVSAAEIWGVTRVSISSPRNYPQNYALTVGCCVCSNVCHGRLSAAMMSPFLPTLHTFSIAAGSIAWYT